MRVASIRRRRVRIGKMVLAGAAAASCAASGLLFGPMPASAGAPSPQQRFELWDIRLGTAAAQLPEDAFTEFACGTNGGPPAMRIGGFIEFAHCRAEPNGLYEVDARYDDELEYWARAHGLAAMADHYGGTRVSVYPVILSVLFD